METIVVALITGTSAVMGEVNWVMVGSGWAHNNMPPYIQVAMWQRTA